MHTTSTGRRTRLAVAGLAAASAAVALTGCSAASDENTLTVQFTQGNEKVYQAYASLFEEANPGVTVKLQSVSTESANGANLSVITSSSAPDVAIVPGNSPAYTSLVRDNGLQTLETVWELADLDTRYDESTDALTLYDGEHYAIADSLSFYSLVYYNKEAFDKAGITAPENHRIESAAALEAITTDLKAAGYQGLAVGGKSGYQLSWMLDALLPTSATPEEMASYSTSWNPANEATTSYTDAAFVDAVAQLQQFGAAGVFQDGYLGASSDQSAALFEQSQAGMIIAGSWYAAILDDKAPDLDYGWLLLPPVDPSSMTQVTGSSTPQFAIPTKAKNPELAEKYLAFMLSSEGQVGAGLAVGGYLPAVNDIQDSELSTLPEAVREMIEDGRTNGIASGWTSTVPSTIGQANVEPLIQSMYDGGATPQSIGEAVQKKVDEVRAD